MLQAPSATRATATPPCARCWRPRNGWSTTSAPYPLYREDVLQVRTKRRKKLRRPRDPIAVPTKADERWLVDFASDQLANGRRFRVPNIVDDFSRECASCRWSTCRSPGQRLARELGDLVDRLPRAIVCDNSPELTSKAIFFRARETSVKLHTSSSPGNPRKTPSSRVSTASFARTASACTGSPVSRMSARSSTHGEPITTRFGPTDHWAASHPRCSPGR